MLKYYSGLTTLALPPLTLLSTVSVEDHNSSVCTTVSICFSINGALKLGTKRISRHQCMVSRRRVRYNDEDEDDDEDETYGHNREIAMLELYSQSARDEALIVRALVDEEEVEVLIFKGFSSCLSYRTSPDPARSILPARAVIKTIDRVRGPFDPSNIEYLEKGLSWETFKSRLHSN